MMKFGKKLLKGMLMAFVGLLALGYSDAMAQTQEYYHYVFPYKVDNTTYYLARNNETVEARSTFDSTLCVWRCEEVLDAEHNQQLYQVVNGTKYYLQGATTSGTTLVNLSITTTAPSNNNKGWRSEYRTQQGSSFTTCLNWREGSGYTANPYYVVYNNGFKISSSSSSSRVVTYLTREIGFWLRAGSPYEVDVLEPFYSGMGADWADHTSEWQQVIAFAALKPFKYKISVPADSPFQIREGSNSFGKVIEGYGSPMTFDVLLNSKKSSTEWYARGMYQSQITIEFDGLLQTRYTLAVEGYVGGELEVSPDNLTELAYAVGLADHQRVFDFDLTANYLEPGHTIHLSTAQIFKISTSASGPFQDALDITIPSTGSVNQKIYVKMGATDPENNNAPYPVGVYEGQVMASYTITIGEETLTLSRHVDLRGEVVDQLLTSYPKAVTGINHVYGLNSFDVKPLRVVSSYKAGSATVSVTLSDASKFEISTTENGTYGSSLTLSNADYVDQTIYIRLKDNLAYGEYQATLYLSAGDQTVEVPISGTMRFASSGTYAQNGRKVVVLNDIEDHNWTYYSGVSAEEDNNYYNTNYQGKLYSPNPRNVRIVYEGGGIDGASPVAISGEDGEDQNEMIYLLTLEQGATASEYPYTVISNPFSKRPKLGSTYYGFGGWKIIKGGEYIKGKANEALLSLDEAIVFENLPYPYTNCISAEIVFQATWVPATVKFGHGYENYVDHPYFDGGTYETNFWVVDGNEPKLDVLGKSNNGSTTKYYSVTITMMTPDGGATHDYRSDGYKVTGHIGMNGEATYTGTVKIEWLNATLAQDGDYSVCVHGQNLFIGRGFTNTSSDAVIFSNYYASYTANHILKIESGTFSGFYHYRKALNDVNKYQKEWVVFGCDYDRAKGDNTKLRIKDVMNAGVGYLSHGIDNATTDLCRAWGKSGTFLENVAVGQGRTENSYYLGTTHTGENKKSGYRYLEIQGGEWKSIAGGHDVYNSTNYPSFDFRMRGGHVYGSVYGGAEYAGCAGTRTLVITGGEINGWVAGGANGTQTSGGTLTAAAYVYVGGNAKVKTDVGSGPTSTIINRAVGGNVFGAGCGLNATSTSGQVTLGTNVVMADNAYVERGVYGGGGFGYCATDKDARVYITGGHVASVNGAATSDTEYDANVEGGVYGGASLNKGGRAIIRMTGGQIDKSLYGGSNLSGTLASNTNIKVVGGRIGTEDNSANVFGGGRGSATVVTGNANVTVSGEAKVFGNVYGGSAEGKVNGKVTVNIGKNANDPVEVEYVFGAGLGATSDVCSTAANNVTVNINGGTVNGNVYGGGENGTVFHAGQSNSANQNTITVNVNNGKVRGYVIGGGVMGASYSKTIVNIKGGLVEGSVYAGAQGISANSILVEGLRTLNMTGGEVLGSLYGGSRNCSDGQNIWSSEEGNMPTSGFENYVSFVNVSGGHVRTQVYGAGFYGVMYGSSAVHIGKSAIEQAYDASANANKLTDITINQPLRIDGSVYAGSNWGTFKEGEGFLNNTTKGYANIFIDGTGYDNSLEHGDFVGNYINIAQGIYGCGTSNYSGELGNDIRIRNYGLPITEQHTDKYKDEENNEIEYTYNELVGTTRSLFSIQQCNNLLIENSHINFLGEGNKTIVDNTILYALYGIGKTVEGSDTAVTGGVFLGGKGESSVDGSSIIASSRIEEITSLNSVKITNFYNENPTLEVVNIKKETGDPYTVFNKNVENTIRINNGHSLKVRYTKGDHFMYGELSGFFRITAHETFNSFAFARPKLTRAEGENYTQNNGWPNENMSDGGFLCYHPDHNFFTDNGNEGTNLRQYPYSNSVRPKTKKNRDDFRVWRISADPNSNNTVIPVALTAQTHELTQSQQEVYTSQGNFWQTSGTVYLPPYTDSSTTTKIEIVKIDFGDQVTLLDAALYKTNEENNLFVYYDDLDPKPRTKIVSRTVAQGDTNIGVGIRAEAAYCTSHPNNSFGLAVNASGNAIQDSVYIVSPTSINGSYQALNFECNNRPGEVPQFNFWLSYSQNITANTTLSPVTLYAHRIDGVRIDNDPNNRGVYQEVGVVDEMIIPITITILTELGGDIDLTTYALYGEKTGSGNETETFSTKCVLPTFTKQQDSEGLKFYVKDVDFIPVNWNKEGAGVGNTERLPKASPMPKNDYQFGMTIAQSVNPDNVNGWMETVPNFNPACDQSLINSGNRYEIGWADGRQLSSIEFTLYYNSFTEGGLEKMKDGLVGTFVFDIGYQSNLSSELGSFKINVKVMKKSNIQNYYIDGINGDDKSFNGAYPDRAKRTLAGIYAEGYTTADRIIVVNPITVGPTSVLTWSSEPVGGGLVRLYRYSGGHTLDTEVVEEPTNPSAPDYATQLAKWNTYQRFKYAERQNRSELVRVKGDFTMEGIVLDGLDGYNWSNNAEFENIMNPHDSLIMPYNPLVIIDKDASSSTAGTFTMRGGSELRTNYNQGSGVNSGGEHPILSKPGGGVYVHPQGTFTIDGSKITQNYIKNETNQNGAGVYLDAQGGNVATMYAAGLVSINDNGIKSGATVIPNNVYLADVTSHIKVNNSGSDPIDEATRVGVTKDAFYTDGALRDFTPYVQGPIGYYIDQLFLNHINFYEDNNRYYQYHDDSSPFGPNTLYFGKTWSEFVTSEPDGFDASHIDSPEELAWAISLVNGLNGQTAAPNANFTVTGDIDLSGHIWRPIGDAAHSYTGHFNGNGYAISQLDIHALYGLGGYGLFGYVGANGVVEKAFVADGTITPTYSPLTDGEEYIGGVAGVVAENGKVKFSEAAASLTANDSRFVLGGLAGQNNGEVHSSMAMPKLNGYQMGGLVGENTGNLYNSFSNVKFEGTHATVAGCLAAVNKGTIENCYSRFRDYSLPNGEGIVSGQFAAKNEGTVQYCYAQDKDRKYVGTGNAPTGHGSYTRTITPYMYKHGDNDIELVAGSGTNEYHAAVAGTWPVMLRTLNKWVEAKGSEYATWMRSSADGINNDYPIHRLPDYTTVASTDGIVLHYKDNFNKTLEKFDANSVTMFVYNDDSSLVDASSHTSTNANVKLYIEEHAALLQNTESLINAYVGFTMDNSGKGNHNYPTGGSEELKYDWHMVSSPIKAAPVGLKTAPTQQSQQWGNWGNDLTPGKDYWLLAEATSGVDGYFPSNLCPNDGSALGKFDFYAFYEPEYHWINLKRNSNNHWHEDGNHSQITYDNEDLMIQGKGYLMAIDSMTFMQSRGELNNGTVKIDVTSSAASFMTGYNFLGNPYHAYLDFDALYEANKYLIANSYVIYDADEGGYIAYTPGTSKGAKVADRYLHPHQGFMAFAKAVGKVEFQQTMCTTRNPENEYHFRKGVEDERPAYPLVNLWASDGKSGNEIVVIEMNRPEVGGAAKAENMKGSNCTMSASYGGEQYSILFTEPGCHEMPVRFKADVDGTFTMHWNTANGQFVYLHLIDNIAGIDYDCLANESYTFEASTHDYASRFKLVFTVASDDYDYNSEDSFAFFDGSDWIVGGQGYFQLVDMNGRVLYGRKLVNDVSRVQLPAVSSGMYLMQVIGDEGSKVQKVILE